MIECGEFAVTLHNIIRSYNKMKDEDKPIPMNRIKAVLAEKQVSAKQLCIAVGKNEATVSHWCNNKIQPSVSQLQEIARFLRCRCKRVAMSYKVKSVCLR